MSTDSVSNDKSDSSSKSDNSSKGVDNETRDSVSKAMEAGREPSAPAASTEPTAQERQASQDRMQAESSLAKSGLAARQADTAVMERTAATMPTAQSAVMTPGTAAATVTLAQATTAPTTGPIGLPEVQLPNAGQAMRALTRGGAVAVAAMGVDTLHSMAEQSAVQRSADIMGADLTTVEGTLAANAHAWGSYNAGFISSAQFSGPTNEIAAQAIGLHEMENPCALGRATRGSTQDMASIQSTVEGALQAYEDGRLTPRAGELAEGWVETYPELSPEDKKLGELPGFTPERMEEFIETYPAEDLGLPTHTGSPPVELPDTSIISTPIAENLGPNIVARLEDDLIVGPDFEAQPGFGTRVGELEMEAGTARPREGRAGARYEEATGSTLTRPDPADPAYDFVDQTTGERIEVKGSVPGVDGVVPEERVTGLINATLDEANLQTGADRIVVDVEGLSEAQIERVRQALAENLTGDIPVQILR